MKAVEYLLKAGFGVTFWSCAEKPEPYIRFNADF
jgi:hypothetical protein